jgi:class 3 adenylate cyclase/tetratricopeptide (TPR) repeat protein
VKFCNQCAAPLDAGAAAGSPPPPERSPRDYTPKHLADRILRSKSALEGERKQVTVMFADVKRSMELAEGVDPEEWHRVMDRFLKLLADGVHRFEGTVNQFTGDGVMALFGAPLAHEDHAQRACYAALALRDELRAYAQELRREHGLHFAVRMGLNSGDVVVGKIGDDLRMDYTAQGHTVGLAARMESLAEVGRIYLGEQTAQLVEGYFELEDLGEFKIKGAGAPLRVFSLEGVGELRTRFDASRARGLSRFVGRDTEMETLEGVVAQALNGDGRVLGVVAEAGTGKSRLCFEFLERCRARGLTVLEGRGVSHGRHIPFVPVLEIVRAYFGIEPDEDARSARQKIAGRLLMLSESFREGLPLMFEFLGVADPEQPGSSLDPEVRQRRLFAMLRDIFAADREPGVVLVEDLHWMDDASAAWVQEMVSATAGTHSLLLLNFRPEFSAGWMRLSHYHQLPLQTLGAEAIRELLDHLLGDDPSVAGLADAVHVRTSGNPFYTEEVVQSLIEAGSLEGQPGSYRLTTPVETLEVPRSVQALLSARIDRLAERDKRVLQTAAVIGKDFSEPLLAAADDVADTELEQALRNLENGEFVHTQALYPVREYTFKHPLTQEVALGSQLRDRRREVHARVARAIEAANPKKLDERAAELAHHWDEAGEVLEAARWHRRAAHWAGTVDVDAATHHWQRVRALAAQARDSDELAELGLEACLGVLNVGWRMGDMSEFDAIYAEGEALAERRGDLRSLAILKNVYGNVIGVGRGELQGYISGAEEALDLARRSGDTGLMLAMAVDLAWPLTWVGRYAEARALAERPVDPLPEDGDLGVEVLGFSPLTSRLIILGWACSELGRLEEADALVEQGMTLARRRGEREQLVWGHSVRAAIGLLRGDAGALDHGRLALEQAEALGSLMNLSMARLYLGEGLIAAGELVDAVRVEEDALGRMREAGGVPVFETYALAALAQALFRLGDFDRAGDVAGEAIEKAQRYGLVMPRISAYVTRARCLVQCAGEAAAARIEEDLARADAIVEETGGITRSPQILEARAEWARRRGDGEEAERHLREAQRRYAETGATGHAVRLESELA